MNTTLRMVSVSLLMVLLLPLIANATISVSTPSLSDLRASKGMIIAYPIAVTSDKPTIVTATKTGELATTAVLSASKFALSEPSGSIFIKRMIAYIPVPADASAGETLDLSIEFKETPAESEGGGGAFIETVMVVALRLHVVAPGGEDQSVMFQEMLVNSIPTPEHFTPSELEAEVARGQAAMPTPIPGNNTTVSVGIRIQTYPPQTVKPGLQVLPTASLPAPPPAATATPTPPGAPTYTLPALVAIIVILVLAIAYFKMRKKPKAKKKSR